MILNMNTKIIFIVLLVAVVSNAANQKPKNVLFIVADDLGLLFLNLQHFVAVWLNYFYKGWADVGYEDPEVITPNINYLARNGVILNQTYTYSICTP